MASSIDNEQFININNILMFVTNHGNFARDLSGVFGYDYGTFFPYTGIQDIIDGVNDNSVVYASGLWIGAIDSASNETRVIVSEYDDEYVPGPMAGGTYQTDTPAFRIYKLFGDSLADNPSADYLNWPIDQGAPYKVVEGDTVPEMLGDQMLWAVFNDADTTAHGNNAGSTNPLGLEVRQTTFGFDRTDPLGNIIFIRLRIVNKGTSVLNECYFSLWSDADLGQFTDDLVGCDTTLSLGFCYNGDNDDNQSGSTPPCVGYDFFQGPLLFTGNPGDVARMWDTTWEGYRNMGMVSFNKYINGTDPDNFQETYNYMRGLNRDGSVYTYLGIPTKYFVSGDPVAGVGDLDFAPADRRFMLSTGPVTFRPGDSTEILAAIIVGQGVDRKTSISTMKFNDQFAQDTYDNNFISSEPPAKPWPTVAVNDNRVSISWTNRSELSPGTFPFEGYTVLQGESSAGPWKQVDNFDVINSFEDVFDAVFDPATGIIEIRRTKDGTNSGVVHDIVIKEDHILGGPLRNLTEYFYKLEAYSINPGASVNKTQTIDTAFSAVPQSPVAGTSYEYTSADTVEVVHVGGSDGSVIPFVIDTKLFDSSTYEVTFTDTVGFRIDTVYDPAFPGDIDHATFVSYDVVWHLVNTTTGDTVLGWQWDQSGTEVLEVIEGLVLGVSGPPLRLSAWEWEGNTRPITGVDWAGSEFFGGVGLLGEFWGSSLSAADLVATEIRWVADGTGQSAYTYRRDLGYAFDGFHAGQNFEVWDVTADPPRQINFAFVEYFDLTDNDGQSADSLWNPGEQVNIDGTPNGTGGREYWWILNSDYTGASDPTYEIDYGFEDADVLYAGWVTYRTGDGKPDPGDIWRFIPNFVNTPSDVYTFTLPGAMMATGEAQLDRINVVPNPFYLYGPYDPSTGNYKLRFQHLPDECTITIFNLGGDLIRKIVKEDPTSSTESWDLRTENGLTVASGIYIYVVESDDFGTKIGKMAVFTEVEALDTY
jgi:hypothetical protein